MTKLCAKDGGDNVACDKVVCVCEGVWQTWCVKESVTKMCVEDVVCSRWCVTKMCVKDGV